MVISPSSGVTVETGRDLVVFDQQWTAARAANINQFFRFETSTRGAKRDRLMASSARCHRKRVDDNVRDATRAYQTILTAVSPRCYLRFPLVLIDTIDPAVTPSIFAVLTVLFYT